MLHIFQLRKSRYTTMLGMGAMLLGAPSAANAQSSRATCPMMAGGGTIVVRGYEVVFAASSDVSGTTVHGLVIVRAPADFRSRQPSAASLERWNAAGLQHSGGGANVGPLMVVYEKVTNTVWLDDSLAVPLRANNNVVLVDVNARGTFVPVGQARIEPHLPLPVTACDDPAPLKRYYETSDTLWARFQASPQIRSFVSP